MMKLQLIYLTLCSLSQAAYISRMAIINHNQHLNSNQHLSPNQHLNPNRIRTSAFRPGVVMRPWNHRIMQAASHRMPYVFYRNQPQQHRYSMKHYTPTRVFTSPWKAATRVPTTSNTNVPSSTEYEFVRAVSVAPAHLTGAIHTIPAPNLSLSEKPIVVLDSDGFGHSHHVSTESPKITYEVTEKYPEPSLAKIEQPIGFSKATSLTSSELQSLVTNGAALQLASELGLSAIALPQTSIHHQQAVLPPPAVVTQPNYIQHNVAHQQNLVPQALVPQQFTLHNFHSLPNPQELMQVGPDGIVISPSALYQPDPAFLQKLQNQLLQRFPGVEFVPYATEIQAGPFQAQPSQIQQQAHQSQFQPLSQQSHIQQAQQSQIQQAQQSQIQQAQQSQIQQAQQSQIQQQIQQSQIQQQAHQDQIQQQAQQQAHQNQIQQAQQSQFQQQVVQHPATIQPQIQHFFLLQNEQFTKQAPSSFIAAESQNQRNVVQRETQEGTATLVPQLIVTNVTENQIELTSISTPQNITFELIAAESRPDTTTLKYVIETTTEEQKSTPIYYAPVTQSQSNVATTGQSDGNIHIAQASQMVSNIAHPNQNAENVGPITQSIGNVQVAQSVGNVITDGFYSAINDVRAAAAALVQVEKPQEPTVTQENITTTTIPSSTINADLKAYFVQQSDTNNQTKTGSEIKPVLGVPFAKAQNSVNVAYTLLRSDDKDAKVAKDGSVYAGQIVEASVSEDQDFNKQKAHLLTRRAPIRLVAVAENKETTSTTTTPRGSQRMTVVKARIPPKSKLTFDDKTGEPVLRIYASYVDSPSQVNAPYGNYSTEPNLSEIYWPSSDFSTSNDFSYTTNYLPLTTSTNYVTLSKTRTFPSTISYSPSTTESVPTATTSNSFLPTPNDVSYTPKVSTTPNDVSFTPKESTIPNDVLYTPKESTIPNDVSFTPKVSTTPNDVSFTPKESTIPNDVLYTPNELASTPDNISYAQNEIESIPNDISYTPNDVSYRSNDLTSMATEYLSSSIAISFPTTTDISSSSSNLPTSTINL